MQNLGYLNPVSRSIDPQHPRLAGAGLANCAGARSPLGVPAAARESRPKSCCVYWRAGTPLRDRSRSVQRRVVEMARVSRSQNPQSQERMQKLYGKLLDASGRVAGPARRWCKRSPMGSSTRRMC
jgi:hypothetical protein